MNLISISDGSYNVIIRHQNTVIWIDHFRKNIGYIQVNSRNLESKGTALENLEFLGFGAFLCAEDSHIFDVVRELC